MQQDDLDGTAPQIITLLNELEQLAPKVETSKEPIGVVYRRSTSPENVNEALEEDEEMFDPDVAHADWLEFQQQAQIPFIETIELATVGRQPAPIVAVDCGIIRLGETEDGLIIALRAAIVSVADGTTTVRTYRTGSVYLRNKDRLKILHVLGSHLGKPDIFVEVEDGKPTRVKSGVADDSQKYSDRFRNWFERILQRVAVQSIDNGIVIFDGALTRNTIDTPTIFLDELGNLAHQHGNTIVGISKQSRLLVADRHVRTWLSETPGRICYRRLSDLMSSELRQRVLGSTYAIRFSPMGLTYRVDVKPVPGQSEQEAIELLFSSCLIRGGYPDILVQAHAYSYFTSPSVTELQAECGAKYRLRAEPEVDFGGVFGPFGGRFK